MPASTPPAPTALPSLPPRSFFPLLARPLLARLAAPFESALAARSFSLSALAAAPPDDRALPFALHDLLDEAHAQLTSVPPSVASDGAAPAGSDGGALLALVDLLASIHRVSTPAGRDALIKLDTSHVLPRRLGPEDLAATAYLDHPTLFAAVRVAPAADAIKNFVLFSAAPGVTPRFDRDALAATSRALSAWFDARHRSAVCEIHLRRRGDELHFEITHGRSTRNPRAHRRIVSMRW